MTNWPILIPALAALLAAWLWWRRQPYKPGKGWRHYGRKGNRVVEYKKLGRPDFTFGEPHMLTTDTAGLSGTVCARFRITGFGFYPQEYPGRDPVISLFFSRKGMDYTWDTPKHRWYSRAFVVCREGEHELRIPLVEGQWQDVGGALDGFTTNDAERVGLCFGQERGGRAHGVAGHGSFELLKFTIE